jgi:hypothetical protein
MWHVVSLMSVYVDGAAAQESSLGPASTQPCFTLWPSQSPETSQFDVSNNGTEYFLSSNAADEAQNPSPAIRGHARRTS